MKILILKAALFLLLQGMLFAVFWKPDLPEEKNYLAATIDKHKLLSAARPPRIILVGGSNLAFGIISDPVQRDLNRAVVNMGLFAGLGIHFLLREVEAQVGDGDIVVLSFEYEEFHGGRNNLVMREILELRPGSLLYVPPAQWKKLITDYGFQVVGGIVRHAFLSRMMETDETPQRSSYHRSKFDATGCYVGHYGSSVDLTAVPKDSPYLASIKIQSISSDTLTRIGRFAALCRERGARCVYSCPPHPPELLLPALPAIEKTMAGLCSIPHLVVLDKPMDHMYPMTDFYDTRYHLTKRGAENRTRNLIAALQLELRRGSKHVATTGPVVE